MLSRFHTIPACHGQTDGRTDRRTELLYQYRASAAVCWRAIKSVLNILFQHTAKLRNLYEHKLKASQAYISIPHCPLDFNRTAFTDSVPLCVMFYFFRYLLLVDACVGLNWILVSFWSHVNKIIIHSFIHSFIHSLVMHKIQLRKDEPSQTHKLNDARRNLLICCCIEFPHLHRYIHCHNSCGDKLYSEVF